LARAQLLKAHMAQAPTAVVAPRGLPPTAGAAVPPRGGAHKQGRPTPLYYPYLEDP